MSQFSDNILQRVAQFISQQQLLPPTSDASQHAISPVFVGLSGGPDSVALLHILHQLGYICHALHCNFHLRGAESDRDEHFCRELCLLLGVELEVKHFDTYAYMHEHHLSLEMAARQLRYNWWASLLNPHASLLTPNASPLTPDASLRIALGHHKDDSIETLLMNLMRGTGIQGLTGITCYNQQTQVVRPLLCLTRQEILHYLLDNNLSYIIDSTNSVNDTLRNQIRNQLLPLMEKMVPQVKKGICSTMQHLQGTADFALKFLSQYDSLTECKECWGIRWHELSLECLHSHINPSLTDDYLFYWQKQFCNTLTHQVVRTSNLIYTSPINPSSLDQCRPILTISELSATEYFSKQNLHNDLVQNFDAETVQQPLSLRRWREGDRMAPLGMNGHTKLVSDLFTNAHYSPMQKNTTWLVTDATGVIIWVIGLRISELHKVSEATTKVLSLCANHKP